MPAKPKVAVLISGRGTNMLALVKAAQSPDFPATIALVVANEPAAAGLAHAQALGVATAVIDHRPFRKDRAAHEAEIDARLRQADVEYVCLAGYMRLLTPYFVDRWAGRMLNIHPSLLPAFPGLHTHARAIAAGARFHGCTVHLVTAQMDDGPILAQGVVPVLADDTDDALASRVLQVENALYPAALAEFLGQRQGRGPALRPSAATWLASPLPYGA